MSDLRRWAPTILEQAADDDRNAEHLLLEEHVARLSQLVANAQPTPTLFNHVRLPQEVDTMVSCLFASMRLRDRSQLPKTLALALRALPGFPGVRDVHFKTPSATTLRKGMLLLDMAYMCHWQEQLLNFTQGQNILYFWLDSSPQGGVDWLLSIMRFISRPDLRRCKKAADVLALSVQKFKSASASNDIEGMVQVVRERHEQRAVLDSSICLHRLIPSGVGSGAAKADDKLSSLCRKLYAESHSMQGLKQLLQCTRGFCTDAGAEMTIGDMAGISVADALPDWMQEQLQAQGDDGDMLGLNDGPMPQLPQPVRDNNDYMFPQALICPGALHILHNMTLEVDKGLEFYDAWLLSFKQVVRLLHADHLRNRFIGTCLLGNFEWMKPQVRKLPEPALWRWNSVIQVLNGLMKCKAVLQAAWSQEKFGHIDGQRQQAHEQAGEGEAAGTDLDVNVVTSAVRSNKFWLYSSMLLHLHSISDDLSAWFEGCPCHPPELFPGRRQAPERDDEEHAFPSEHFAVACQSAGLPCEQARNCPLAGQRSTELACGELLQLLDDVGQHRLTDLLKYANAGAHDRDLESALSDYSRGRAQYAAYLTQKLRCFQELPWKFAALNHPDPGKVRSQAVSLVELLDQSPRDRELHHRVTWMFLCGDGEGNEAQLLQQLRALAAGQLSLDDPRVMDLRTFAEELRFLPTVERVQEADHAIVKKFINMRTVSGPYVSTAIRMAEMEQLFDAPQKYQHLLEQWPKILDPDVAAKRLGLWGHPLYQGTVQHKTSWREKRNLLAVLIYVLDPESQFRSTKKARDKRAKHMRRLQKFKDDFFKQLNPEVAAWSPDNIERRAAAQHMQERMEAGRLYSMPPDTVALPPLQARLQAMQQVVLPTAQLESSQNLSLSVNDSSALQLADVSGGSGFNRGFGSEEIVPAPPCPDVPILFFRLNYKAPARHRTLPLPAASGYKLAQTDMTVTVHSSVQCQDACWVEVEASKAEGLTSPVAVLSVCSADAKNLPSLLQQWSTFQRLSYTLKGVPASMALSTLLGTFVAQRAFADAPASQHVALAKSETSAFNLCKALQLSGHIQCLSETSTDAVWKLTSQGVQNLVPMHEVCRPSLVFPTTAALLDKVDLGHEAVQNFTTWELLQVLIHRGFQMKPLPSRKKDRQALPPHSVRAPHLTWYCGSATSVTLESAATKAYMRSLVLAPELFTGIVNLG